MLNHTYTHMHKTEYIYIYVCVYTHMYIHTHIHERERGETIPRRSPFFSSFKNITIQERRVSVISL